MIAITFKVHDWDEALADYRYFFQRTHANHSHLGDIQGRYSGPCTSIWRLLGLCEEQRALGHGRRSALAVHVTGGTDHGAKLSPAERTAYEEALLTAVGGTGLFVWHIPRDHEEDRYDFHLLAPAHDAQGRLRCRKGAGFKELLRQCCAEVTTALNEERLKRGAYVLGNLNANWDVYYVQPERVLEPLRPAPEANANAGQSLANDGSAAAPTPAPAANANETEGAPSPTPPLFTPPPGANSGTAEVNKPAEKKKADNLVTPSLPVPESPLPIENEDEKEEKRRKKDREQQEQRDAALLNLMDELLRLSIAKEALPPAIHLEAEKVRVVRPSDRTVVERDFLAAYDAAKELFSIQPPEKKKGPSLGD